MNKLFGNLFTSFMLIIILIIIVLMASFAIIYSNSYEQQIVDDNDKQAFFIAQSLYSFMDVAYKMVEELSYNSDVLSMDNARQTHVFTSVIGRNDYFELLYAQGMDGMQTGRSSGELGNRKERWWFIQMEQTQEPFISESYYSVGTNMPCASIFFPMWSETDGGSREMIGIMAGDIKLSALHDLVYENANIEEGSWAFILDGRGVVVAHPDSTFQEELYNYRTLTRTVTVKDEDGIPIQDAAGNLTEELHFEISDAYIEAIEDMMRGNISNAVFEEDGRTIFLSYRPVLLDGRSEPWYVLAVQEGEVAMRTRNAVLLLMAVSTAVIIITAVLIVLYASRAISSRVKMEAMKVEYEKEKAQASERAKSEFLAAMSHEIRTPLNAILGITQIKMMNRDVPPEYAEAFNKINISGTVLLGLINDILDMSKIESGHLEINPVEYDVPSFINDAVQMNIVRIGSKPLELVLNIDEKLPCKLYGDEMRLKQVLSNLLSNAIKYSEKGKVELCAAVIQSPDGGQSGDDEICIRFTVSDTGQGIKKEDLDRLFTQYKRFNAEANRTTEGTGLGLSITKNIVDLMGGTIEAESEFGVGSIFTVTVKQKVVDASPIGTKVAESFHGLSYVDSRYRERRKTIRNPMPYGKVLVVDDSPSNLYVAVGLLSPYELKIETAESGYAAINKVEDGAVYDIIFMDHMMPQMDGIETTAKLRSMGYEGTIVALTANALVGNDTMFKENGFDGFISKPIDTRRLDSLLNKFIKDRHSESETIRAQVVQEPAKPDLPPELIEIFCREAEDSAKALRRLCAEGDIKRFTTTVHAMKSALANMGEMKLSERAALLEKAGTDNDTETIGKDCEGFTDDLEALADRLMAEIKKEKTVEAEANEDTDFLQAQLEIISAACGAFDDAAVYKALDTLEEKTWSAETAARLKEIRNAVYLDSDFDKASELAGA